MAITLAHIVFLEEMHLNSLFLGPVALKQFGKIGRRINFIVLILLKFA